jgi:hypothetical protein
MKAHATYAIEEPDRQSVMKQMTVGSIVIHYIGA